MKPTQRLALRVASRRRLRTEAQQMAARVAAMTPEQRRLREAFRTMALDAYADRNHEVALFQSLRSVRDERDLSNGRYLEFGLASAPRRDR